MICDYNTCFVDSGVYKLKNSDDLFVCKPITKGLGKLVRYEKENNFYTEKNSYFLNFYDNEDKNYFLNRENYDMIGKIGQNYFTSDQYLFD